MTTDTCRGAADAIRAARDFPHNTCPASRHTQIIGEYLAERKPYPMLQEEPEHCAGSLLATVAALYEARTEIARLRARVAVTDKCNRCSGIIEAMND